MASKPKPKTASKADSLSALLAEAEAARTFAQTTKNASAMVSAVTLKAKLCGLLTETAPAPAGADGAQTAELKTASDLLADAAHSLGLPRTATPAQIVGALADRPLATPEAFLLLHTGALTNVE